MDEQQYKALARNVATIRGWATFFGILFIVMTIVSLVLGIIVIHGIDQIVNQGQNSGSIFGG